jgi:protein arginine kinase
MENSNVISSRIRLARNFSGVPFVSKMTPEQKKELTEEIHAKVKEDNRYGLNYIDMANVTAIQAGSMVEEHLISIELANNRAGKALLLSDDKKISAMLCEEDHLRLQLFANGYGIKELWEKANDADDWFDSIKPYAFSEELGYLTSCPTNLGTGLRASVMLHLPALTESGYIEKFINAAASIGLTFRGTHGEGSEVNGCLYQLSNQISMGISEADTMERLIQAADKITENVLSVSFFNVADHGFEHFHLIAQRIFRCDRSPVGDGAEFARIVIIFFAVLRMIFVIPFGNG